MNFLVAKPKNLVTFVTSSIAILDPVAYPTFFHKPNTLKIDIFCFFFLMWLNAPKRLKVNLESIHPAVFPTNLHARWLQGFALQCADESALFVICYCLPL